MKLQFYQSGQVQSLDGVNPDVYREMGRAQMQFAQALDETGQAVEEQYMRVSTADRVAAEAELRTQGKMLRDKLMRSEFTPVEEVPEDMRDERYIKTHVDADGFEQQVMPTRFIADVMYKRTMDEHAARVRDNARTRLGKQWIDEAYRGEVAPQGEHEVAEIVYRQEQTAAVASGNKAATDMVNSLDEVGFRRTVEALKLSGVYSSDHAQKVLEQGLGDIAVGEYQEAIRQEWTSPQQIAEMEKEIENDKRLSLDQKQALKGQLKSDVYNRNAWQVDDAAVEGNVGRLNSLKAMYSSPEYNGPLDPTERRRIVASIDSAISSVEARVKDQADLAHFDLYQQISRGDLDYEQGRGMIRTALQSGVINDKDAISLEKRLVDRGIYGEENDTREVELLMANPDVLRQTPPQKMLGQYPGVDPVTLSKYTEKYEEITNNPIPVTERNNIVSELMVQHGWTKPQTDDTGEDAKRYYGIKNIIDAEIAADKRATGREPDHDKIREISNRILFSSSTIRRPGLFGLYDVEKRASLENFQSSMPPEQLGPLRQTLISHGMRVDADSLILANMAVRRIEDRGGNVAEEFAQELRQVRQQKVIEYGR